jgi:hypothetical protein
MIVTAERVRSLVDPRGRGKSSRTVCSLFTCRTRGGTYCPPVHKFSWGPPLRASVVGILVVIVAVACGSGASDADARAVGQSALTGSQMKVSPGVEICIGKSMTETLGLSTAQTAAKQKNFVKLPKAQRVAAFAALDKCVPSEAFVAAFVTSGSGAQTDTTALEACLAKEFKGKVGSVLEAFKNPKGDSATRDLLDKCPSGDLAARFVAGALQHSGVPDAVIQCSLQKIAPELKLSDVIAQSPDLTAKLESSVTECKFSK